MNSYKVEILRPDQKEYFFDSEKEASQFAELFRKGCGEDVITRTWEVSYDKNGEEEGVCVQYTDCMGDLTYTEA